MDLKVNEFIVKPTFKDVDMMNIVHHSCYAVWLEEARFNFVRRVFNITIKDMAVQKIYMPVVLINIKYLHHVSIDDCVHISTILKYNVAAYFSFYYILRLAGDPQTKIASASTKHVFTDDRLKLKISMPEFYERKFKEALHNYPSCIGIEEKKR